LSPSSSRAVKTVHPVGTWRVRSQTQDRSPASLQIDALPLDLFDLSLDALVDICAIRVAGPAEMLDALLSFLPRFRSKTAETDACENMNGLLQCDNHETPRFASSRNRNNEPSNKFAARGRNLREIV
jgi:hypothetical protein